LNKFILGVTEPVSKSRRRFKIKKEKLSKKKNYSRIAESCYCISGRTVSSVFFFKLVCDFYAKTHTGIFFKFNLGVTEPVSNSRRRFKIKKKSFQKKKR